MPARRRLAAALIALLAALLGPAALPGAGQAGSGAETEILRLENDRVRALLRQDYPALERLMASDCLHIERDGTQRTTAALLARFRAEPTTFATFVIDENQVRLYGTTAVVTGRYHNALRLHGQRQPTKYARHTRVWVRQADGRWRLVSHQATEMPAPAGALSGQ